MTSNKVIEEDVLKPSLKGKPHIPVSQAETDTSQTEMDVNVKMEKTHRPNKNVANNLSTLFVHMLLQKVV